MRATVLKVALVAALLILAVWHLDLEAFVQAMTPRLLLAGVLIQPLIAVGLLAAAARFRALVGVPGAGVALAAKAQVLALGMNALLPARLSEILKVTYLRDHAGVAFSAGCAAVLLERLIDVAFLGALATLSVLLFVTDINVTWIVVGLAAAAAVMALPALEPLAVRILRRFPGRLARDTGIAVVQHASQRFREGAVLKGVLFGLVVWAVAYANICFFLYVATGSGPQLALALAVFVAALVGVAIPALPGGFGTFEAAVVFVLTRFGYPFEEALAMALVLHAAEIAPFLIGALAIALRERIGIESLVRDTARTLKAGD